MHALKWLLIVVGMCSLLVGLNIQAADTLAGTQEHLATASWIYVFGALVLIAPPAIEFSLATSPADRDFSRLLVVLEVFLVGSGLLFFWDSNLPVKVLVRVMASLGVTAYLKYGMQALPEFRWSFFIVPHKALRYHWDCLRGHYPPAYPLSLGIDWLGAGYAFLEFTPGKAMLLLGSLFLFLSALRGFRATKAGVPLAWTILNLLYVLYGGFFLALAVARDCWI